MPQFNYIPPKAKINFSKNYWARKKSDEFHYHKRFNPGDQVIAIIDNPPYYSKGQVCIVIEDASNSEKGRGRGTEYEKRFLALEGINGGLWGWNSAHFELFEHIKPTLELPFNLTYRNAVEFQTFLYRFLKEHPEISSEYDDFKKKLQEFTASFLDRK